MSEQQQRIQKPWEQQVDESAKAFEAFAAYRDMGAKRSTAKAAEKVGKSKKLMDQWSSKHDWVARAQAFDGQEDRFGRKERRKALVAMARRHATIAAAMQDKVVARLKTLNAEDLSLSDLRHFFALSVKIERDARRLTPRDIFPSLDDVPETMPPAQVVNGGNLERPAPPGEVPWGGSRRSGGAH